MLKLNKPFAFITSNISLSSMQEMGWVILGQIMNIIFSFIILKLLSKLGTAHYGIYALVVSIAILVGMVFHTPLSQGLIRFYYHYMEKKLVWKFVGIVYRILLVFTIVLLIISAVSLLIPRFIETKQPGMFFMAACLYILASKLNEFLNSVLNLIRKRKQNSILLGSEKAITIILFYYLILSNSLNLVYVLLTLVVVAMFSSTVKLFIFIKSLPDEDEKSFKATMEMKQEITGKLMKYMIPFFIWGFIGWLQFNGDKWIINGFLSTSDVGIYSVMLGLITGLIITPFTVMNDFWSPIIYKQYADMEDTNRIKKGIQYIRINSTVIFIIALFSTLFTYLWGKDLIILISNSDYAAYWYLLPIICLGTGLYYTGQSLTIHGMALNVPNKYLPPKVAVGVVSVGLNILMIKIFGLDGIAYTILIIGFLYLIYIMNINRIILSAVSK